MSVVAFWLPSSGDQNGFFTLCPWLFSGPQRERPPLLAAICLGPKWVCVAWRKWWAHQDLNLGPIDYEDPGDLGYDLVVLPLRCTYDFMRPMLVGPCGLVQ